MELLSARAYFQLFIDYNIVFSLSTLDMWLLQIISIWLSDLHLCKCAPQGMSSSLFIIARKQYLFINSIYEMKSIYKNCYNEQLIFFYF